LILEQIGAERGSGLLFELQPLVVAVMDETVKETKQTTIVIGGDGF
jgi:hypothetical protein